MYKILQTQILDNTLESYLLVAVTFIVALLIKRLVSKYLATVIFKGIMKSGSTVNKQAFINLIVPPLDMFLVLLITFISLDRLTYPRQLEFNIFKISIHKIIEALSSGILIIVFIWLLLRIIEFIAMVLEERATISANQNDNQLVVFFKDFLKVILLIVGILLLLRFSFHQNIGNLLTGLSIVGAAIALATRESMENLIASFIIFFDKPFITGDTVKVEGFSGTVEKIGLRSTRVRTDQKTYITIPNKKMVDSIMDNVSMRTQRRIDLQLEINLSTEAGKLEQLVASIRQIISTKEVIDSNIYLSETGKNAHIIVVECFITISQSMKEFLQLRQQINLEIISLMEQNKIELAAASSDMMVQLKEVVKNG